MIGEAITQLMTRYFLAHKIVGLIATRQVGDTGGPVTNTMMTPVKRRAIISKRRKKMLRLNSTTHAVGQMRSEFLLDEALGEDKGIDHHLPLSPDGNDGLFLQGGLIIGIFEIRQMIVINGGKTDLSLIPHSGTNYGAALGTEIVLNSASML